MQSMTKMIEVNEVTDHIGPFYIENEIELL